MMKSLTSLFVILPELSGTISYKKKEKHMAGFSLSSGFVDSKKNIDQLTSAKYPNQPGIFFILEQSMAFLGTRLFIIKPITTKCLYTYIYIYIDKHFNVFINQCFVFFCLKPGWECFCGSCLTVRAVYSSYNQTPEIFFCHSKQIQI